jgi:hypothetical protein
LKAQHKFAEPVANGEWLEPFSIAGAPPPLEIYCPHIVWRSGPQCLVLPRDDEQTPTRLANAGLFETIEDPRYGLDAGNIAATFAK